MKIEKGAERARRFEFSKMKNKDTSSGADVPPSHQKGGNKEEDRWPRMLF